MNKNGLSLTGLIACLGLMLVPVSVLQARAAALPFDSVGVQVVKGQQFLVHQVQAKETFFVLARKYQLPAKKIMAANPQAKGGLKTGDLVYIPRYYKAKKAAMPAYRYDAKGNKVHRVSDKQTLFAISRLYKLNPQDIIRWNSLKSDQVTAGQLLIVGLAPKPTVKKAAEAPKPVLDPLPAVQHAPIVLAGKKERPGLSRPNKTDSTRMLSVVSQIRESGIAEVISGSTGNKYLALHHSAPIGSYITVVNQMNGRQISVRVIGTLPDVGLNEKVIIKLSSRAQQKLGILDRRFLVDVIYTPQ